jgi:hypothetical protein
MTELIDKLSDFDRSIGSVVSKAKFLMYQGVFVYKFKTDFQVIFEQQFFVFLSRSTNLGFVFETVCSTDKARTKELWATIETN